MEEYVNHAQAPTEYFNPIVPPTTGSSNDCKSGEYDNNGLCMDDGSSAGSLVTASNVKCSQKLDDNGNCPDEDAGAGALIGAPSTEKDFMVLILMVKVVPLHL